MFGTLALWNAAYGGSAEGGIPPGEDLTL